MKRRGTGLNWRIQAPSATDGSVEAASGDSWAGVDLRVRGLAVSAVGQPVSKRGDRNRDNVGKGYIFGNGSHLIVAQVLMAESDKMVS
jgi:hypothetical protein